MKQGMCRWAWLVCAAGFVHATGASAMTPMFQGESQLSRKTIEKFDPVRLLLDKRKELKLDEKQRAELESQDESIKWNIGKLAARIDSAQRGMGTTRSSAGRGRRGAPPSEDPLRSPEASREKMLADRKIIIESIAELQRENDLRTGDALSVLTAEQRPQAGELLKKRTAELLRILDDAGYTAAVRASQRSGGPGRGRLF